MALRSLNVNICLLMMWFAAVLLIAVTMRGQTAHAPARTSVSENLATQLEDVVLSRPPK